MKEPEYKEGPEALENFERLATAVLRTPKPAIEPKKKKQIKSASLKKPKKADKD